MSTATASSNDQDHRLRIRGNATSRKARVSTEGQVYFLTTATMYRRPVFQDTDVCRCVCRAAHQAWVWRDSILLAWVLMPDHWHGLVRLGCHDDLSQLMGRFKAVTARAVPERARVNGWLWHRGFQDQALHDDDDVRKMARYLVANPLRAGIVDDLGRYPYWNATWIGQSSDDVIPI